MENNIFNIVDWGFFLLLPALLGGFAGWLIRHGRMVVDRGLSWEKEVQEQIEDLITFLLAFALGGGIGVLTGTAYLGWFLAYFSEVYAGSAIVSFVSVHPLAVIGYYYVGYTFAHVFAWLYKQPRE